MELCPLVTVYLLWGVPFGFSWRKIIILENGGGTLS